MKLADEITGIVYGAVLDAWCQYDPTSRMEKARKDVAAKLEPILDALRNLYMKTEVNDYNYCEYDAAEAAIALLEE